MKRNYITTCLIFLFFFTQSSVWAQQPLPCGNPVINVKAFNNARHFQLSQNNREQAVKYLVRVYFHNVTNDDGSNGTITADQLATEYANLQSSYAADNICFLNAGTDNVKNTFLNTLFNADNDPEGTFFAPYQVPNCVNVFYTQKINGNNTACNPPCGIGGIALGGIPGTFYLVSKSNIGSGSTVSHEMGHTLGLLHTFEKNFGFEKIDGSNASYAGDQITDTPADPYVYNGNACFLVSADSCRFIGICPDSNNAINYTPPYTNLMGYWWRKNCYPNLAATNGQFQRVNSFLGSYIPLIGCSSALDVTQPGIVVSTGYYMNSALNTFTTSGTVQFIGSAKATMGGTTVHLQPGFRASPDANGIVRIEVKPCN